MSSLQYAEEDKKANADTHLAAARSQNTGTGILGIILKIKDSRISGCLFQYLSGSIGGSTIKGYIILQKIKLERQLYYGMAILIAVFIITGLTTALKGTKEDEAQETVKEQEIIPEEKAEVPDKNIRVLLMTDGYKNTIHPSVTVSAASGIVITYGEAREECDGETQISIAPDDARFQNGPVRIQAKEGKVTVNSLKRGYGTPSYEGILELRTTAEGIAVINELPVESYLCGVVPSEMPASYELEALKAQAVCARSYAYRQMEDYGYPEYEAHVDDSTGYQVYGNSEPQESTVQAVQETAGEVVRLNGQIVTTYYYSTSCGKTTSMKAWGSEETPENCYLQSVEVKNEDGDYEKDLPWYRWEAQIPVQTLSNLIGLNTGTDIGTVQELHIQETGPGDIVLKIEAVGNKGSVVVETENKIRRALGGSGYKISKQDGTEVKSSVLLPSAFFTVEKSEDMFIIRGGGYGHGIGMSQNGANEMAKCGKDYKEILTFFYSGVTVEA